jgi:hypothetical protein
MKAHEVFTPSTFPTVTLIDEHLKDKETLLRRAMQGAGTITTISGPSKSGKTVFVQKVIGEDNIIHVTGPGVVDPVILWNRAFSVVGTPIGQTDSEDSTFQSGLATKVGGGIQVIGKVEGSVEGSASYSVKSGFVRANPFDHLQQAIKDFSNSDFVLFVDDFHYIPKSVQEMLAQQFKEAARQNVKIIVASVPYHSDDVLRGNPDLQGRLTAIDFDYWQANSLRAIAEKGFRALNVRVPEIVMDRLAEEAGGSPQLMQLLCLNACFEAGTYERSAHGVDLLSDEDFFRKVCAITSASSDFASVVNKVKDGPKQRGSIRISYSLKDGSTRDVYPIILKALALDPPRLNHRYQQLVGRIQQICANETPVGSSVTGACAHIADIANAFLNRQVIEWDSDNDVLDIRDPYFLFYLRWSAALDA